MTYTLSEALNLSILIAGLIALFRFRKMDPAYLPLILLIWIAGLNELLSLILISYNYYIITVNNNIYVLLESLLILWFFKRLKIALNNITIFSLLIFSFLLVWSLENFVLGSIFTVSSWFRIFYSFIVVLLSINIINHLIVTQKNQIVKMPLFLICIGFVTYFTYKVLIEAFWLYGLNNSKNFRISVYSILTYLNFLVNLLLALAVIWIPRKREYILLS